jgi:ribonuclease HI
MFATIYTDASGREINNKKVFSYSYYIRCDKGVHSGADVIPIECCDINHAEMYCIVKAVKDCIDKFKNTSRILVVTDSISAQYSLWRGSDKIKYSEVIQSFRKLEAEVEKIMIKWTKGHRTDNSDRAYLNNKCDERASSITKKLKSLG